MTMRTRRPEGGIRTRLGRMVDSEERRQGLITAAFIAAIGLVIFILIGAVLLAWYNDNLRPLARVSGTEVQPQELRDYLRFQQWRIERDDSRVTTAQIDGVLDEQEASVRHQELSQQAENLSTSGLSDLVDLMYQTELAAAEGITVDEAAVDAAFAEEIANLERRHVQKITVEPQAADEENGPTAAERDEAMARALEALDQLQGGADWEDIAREYGTDTTSQAGGDLGFVTELAVGDRLLADKVFELEADATTSVILGEDGNYHIGRAVEIEPAAEQPGLRTDMAESVSEQAAKDVLRLEAAAAALEDKRIAEALAEIPEQIHLGVIYIEGLATGDADEAEGEVHYSEIVFAPGDNLETAPDLPEDDPRWERAKADADDALEELQAFTDEELVEKFAEKATAQSDSPTGEDGGDAGFVTRSIPPVAVSDALWNEEHEEFDLIGPIRGDAAWYVLLFHEKRESVETRLQEVRDALAAPDADFAAIAEELSDGPQAEDGGDSGWFTRASLESASSTEFAEGVFALDEGEVSDALELGDGHYFAKALERMTRAYDPDQVPGIEASAFTDWYATKREEAEANGTIVIPGETDVPDELEGGEDQP